MSELTQAQFDRIDRALGVVLENPADFDDFAWDFAANNADRLDRFGLDTSFSEARWAQVEKIEREAREKGHDV